MRQKYPKFIIAIGATLISMLFPVLAYAGNPPDASHSSLTGTEVPAGGTQSTVTVVLQDSSGTPLTGDVIKLSDTSDSTIVFSPATATLDASGSATFSAASSQAGTDSIDVIDTTTNTTLSALGHIVFDPAPTPASQQCSSTAPTSAPNLYQVVAANSTATLYFSPPSSGFDGFTISYGLDANADTYNATFSQGSTGAAVNYTINSLTPNTKYYFKVRANNGCATGPWSNVMSSSGQTSLPVTGSMDFVYLGLGALILIFGGLRAYAASK
jgi:hypothetical protein